MGADPGADITYTVWQDVSAALDQHYRVQLNKFYFNAEYYDGQQPLENTTVLPGVSFFFGPKVVNLMILGYPYGWSVGDDGDWEESWPPDGLVDAITRHQAMYPKWTSYKTYVWIDYIIVKMIEAKQSNSNIRAMMDALTTHMQDVCTQLAAYGWTYVDQLQSQPDVSYFYPYLDPLYDIKS